MHQTKILSPSVRSAVSRLGTIWQFSSLSLCLSPLAFAIALALVCGLTSVQAQSYTSTSDTGSWNTSRWNNSSDAAPYTSSYTANRAVSFTSGTYSFAGMGGAINVGNITVASGVTVNFTAAGGTFQTAGLVRTINVGSGGTLDFSTQVISAAAGTGFIKNGAGVLALAGNTFAGGFTLNAGTVIMRATDAMGGGATNVLTLNGGVVASNASRSMSNAQYGGGIVIGGNVQFGEMAANVALASDTANLSFANNVSLGNATRTLTLGNGGTVTFSAIISNTATNGLTFAANANATGRFDITGTANTFTGDLRITGGEVRFSADGSLGNVNNNIIIDGGRFASVSGGSFAISSTHAITVGDTAGTSISAPGSGVLAYDGVIADISGKTGSWAKQGGGTLALGGVNTYTGDTAINNGTLQLTTGNDRLPTGTTVSLGQSASANLGILDLNGRSQQIAGLNSVAGTNAAVTKNTVTSSVAATLTLGGNGSYSFSAGTAANSGVITGAISLIKTGGGTQTFGEANSYTGKTSINGGFIAGSGESIFGTAPGSFTADQITLNGGGIKATGNISFSSNRGITLGSSGGTFDTNGNTMTLTNVVTGSGGITKAGSGTLVLNASHTYTGGLTVNAGVVQLTHAGGLNSNTVTFGSGVVAGTKLQLNGNNVTVSGLSTNATPGSAVVESGSGSAGTDTLTVDNSTSNTFAGVLQNGSTRALALTKQGAGTLVLSGTNTYSGSTLVGGGNLQVGQSGSGKTGTGTVSVNGSGAVLSGTGTVDGSTTTVILGTIKPGDSGGVSTGTLNTKTLIFVPVSTPSTVAELQILGSTAGSNLSADKINITGDLTLNSFSNIFVNGSGYTAAVGDSFTLIDWSGALTAGGFSTGTNLRTGANAAGNEGNLDLPDITGIGFWDISDLAGSGALTLTVVVPEPARGILLLLGLVSLIFRRRKING